MTTAESLLRILILKLLNFSNFVKLWKFIIFLLYQVKYRTKLILYLIRSNSDYSTWSGMILYLIWSDSVLEQVRFCQGWEFDNLLFGRINRLLRSKDQKIVSFWKRLNCSCTSFLSRFDHGRSFIKIDRINLLILSFTSINERDSLTVNLYKRSTRAIPSGSIF